MVNFNHLKEFPFKHPLEKDDHEIISQLKGNRATSSAINRLTFRLHRIMDGTHPLAQTGATTIAVDFRKEFPLVGDLQIPQIVYYFQLKGFTTYTTNQPQTYLIGWDEL